MAESFRVTSGGRPIESENMGVRLANRIAQVFTSANRDCVIDVWSDEGLHKLKFVSRHTDDTIVDVAKEALKLSGVVNGGMWHLFLKEHRVRPNSHDIRVTIGGNERGPNLNGRFDYEFRRTRSFEFGFEEPRLEFDTDLSHYKSDFGKDSMRILPGWSELYANITISREQIESILEGIAERHRYLEDKSLVRHVKTVINSEGDAVVTMGCVSNDTPVSLVLEWVKERREKLGLPPLAQETKGS